MLDNSASSTASPSKPTRVFFSTDKGAVSPAELNQLFRKAGLPAQPVDKLAIALQHSLLCLAAWTFGEKKLAGFVRATGDGVFNATLWDLVVDPNVTHPDATKTLLMNRLKREMNRIVPNCTISMMANPQDHHLLRLVNFAEDKTGIKAMALGSAMHPAPR
ncbi:MAG: hypothetical protein ACFB0C_08955 [Leptolyngbyaceae cyanobacterium]